MARKVLLIRLAVFLAVTAGPAGLRAETGHEAWLRYAPLPMELRQRYSSLPANVVALEDSQLMRSALNQLSPGVQGMLGQTLRVKHAGPGDLHDRAIVLGTFAELRAAAPELSLPRELGDDGFWIGTARVQEFHWLVVGSPTSRGVLYGVFALLSKMARGESIDHLNEVEQPYEALRWVNQWDNLDGSIERGYAGRSSFFDNGSVRADLTRASEYARLLASIGINGCAINNVNADPRVLANDFLPQLARVADVFRPWGVKLSISVDVSSPKAVGRLDTYDPLDTRVAAWWRDKVDQIYTQIPDFGGFVVKADSEGRPGPSAYGRTPADAANVIARALRPHGGVLFYRAFVYNHHLDWRDLKADRARAAYDIFHPLDGKFEDNVVVQIKYGPIDFQVREPVSPLFGGLRQTNEAAELQVTQEYTGQQRHLCFLAPMWKEVLDFDLRAGEDARDATPVKELIAGKTWKRPTGGMVGVVNAGMDANWLGHPLAMANLYAFGRLAWNPNLDAKTIAEEWTRLTFGNNAKVVGTITTMLMSSWHAYESYTGPLGAGTLTDILGSHYGPGVESSERNGWGHWHRADHQGIGMDRTVATGTGYTAQYPPPVAQIYESLATTPDELLLFFHHVPYTYVLHSGKTVIQHIYDSHYEGAEQAQEYVTQWESLKGLVDEERYEAVLARLEYQAGHAIVWRDAICNWFLRVSGISDVKGRVGNHPNRVEAEAMTLRGYVPVDVTPWEDASAGKAIECEKPQGCTASLAFTRPAGKYDLAVQYFDQNNGDSKFRLLVHGRAVDEWVANDHLPAKKIGGDSSTRRWIRGVALHPGDEITIEGIPDGEEHAPLDYVEIWSAQP